LKVRNTKNIAQNRTVYSVEYKILFFEAPCVCCSRIVQVVYRSSWRARANCY